MLFLYYLCNTIDLINLRSICVDYDQCKFVNQIANVSNVILIAFFWRVYTKTAAFLNFILGSKVYFFLCLFRRAYTHLLHNLQKEEKKKLKKPLNTE